MQRILALDLGEKRIGVAVSDEKGIIAQPVGFIKRRDWQKDIQVLRGYITSYKVTKLLIGLPKSLNGTIGPRAKLALEFARRLEVELDEEIIIWDERLTTAQAEKVLIQGGVKRRKRKLVIDKLAAVLILQNYLDYLKENPLAKKTQEEVT